MTEEQKQPEPAKKPARIIKSTDRKPCGCVVTEYSDGAKQLGPCVPCGLFAAAQSMGQAASVLGNAADALAAVATTIRNQQAASIINEAARSAAHNLRPVT